MLQNVGYMKKKSMLKKKKKRGVVGGQHIKKEKGSNIGSCPQVPARSPSEKTSSDMNSILCTA